MPPPTPLEPLRSTPASRLYLPTSPSRPSLLSRACSPRSPLPLRASASGGPVRGGAAASPTTSVLDALFSAAELLCFAPPAICSVVCATRLVFPSAGASLAPARPLAGGRLFVVQYVLLVGAVAIGSLIRRRQWGQLCRVASGAAAGGVDFAGRMGKVEGSVRSMVAAVGVLSRTVEKLSVRFRVLRRTLRDPISEVLLNLS
ncbi:hypothetical protein GUJ93_ZPchr0008g13071 [Zizania palustris]|uniref:Uncharacterized protein n=1 Tax=Zizania palustris TaxID=103762 RepID=A0A8J5R035_ZIZPA|nr:hypothetical protein GUJ93_ZPchr0008g13071 [Zizania palustris]